MSEIFSIVFGGISAIAAIISSVTALRAKAEVKKLNIEINSMKNDGDTSIANSGSKMSGVIVGNIKGDINAK